MKTVYISQDVAVIVHSFKSYVIILLSKCRFAHGNGQNQGTRNYARRVLEG